MNIRATLAAAVLLGSGFALTPAHAVEEDELPTAESIENLQALIADVIEESGVPAVGIAMVDESGPVWVGALGKASLEDDVDADEYSMFRIGSTSKMFVSLSVLKLVEEGRLSLDDKLADLAPEIEFENPWENTDPIRIVHLLEHTTGWDDIHLPEYAHNVDPPVSLKEGLDYHPHSRRSRWVPGTRSSYCNAGPPVAAYVVQKITGQDFEDYVQENFFDPMGMETMTYRRSEAYRDKGVTLYANGNQPQPYWNISMRPSGSINASPRDMAKFVAFFLNRGSANDEQLVSPDSIDRMETPGSTTAARAGQEVGYALSNYASRHNSFIYQEHGGGVIGGLTEFAYLPEAGVGHAIMVNSDNFQAFADISDLVRNFETRNLAESEIPQADPITDAHREVQGLYHPINSRQQAGYFLDRIFGVARFWFEDDELLRKNLLGGDDPLVYLAASPTLYRSGDTGAIALSRVEDPLAGPVLHAGLTVYRPVSPVIAYGQLAIAALWGLSIATSLLYALVWGVRRLRKRIPPGATIRVRAWPLMASVSIVAVVALFSMGMSDPFNALGKPSPVSIGITVATIAFALFALAGAYTSVKVRGEQMNAVNYWHSAISSGLHLIVALYLAWFGVIGLMTWT